MTDLRFSPLRCCACRRRLRELSILAELAATTGDALVVAGVLTALVAVVGHEVGAVA